MTDATPRISLAARACILNTYDLDPDRTLLDLIL